MTSRFRIWLAALICVMALLSGLVGKAFSPAETPSGRLGRVSIPQLSEAEDIDRFAQAILESELFPNLQLRPEGADAVLSNGPQTVEELAQSLQDPSLSAFVKRGDVWSIILYGVAAGSETREVGSQLADGWIIQSITSTSVELSKGGETRLIEVFKAEPDTE